MTSPKTRKAAKPGVVDAVVAAVAVGTVAKASRIVHPTRQNPASKPPLRAKPNPSR
jgi:hypothetical protein